MATDKARFEPWDRDAKVRSEGCHGAAEIGSRPITHEIVLDGRPYRLVEVEARAVEPAAAIHVTVADRLTARELEVAKLVAMGLANKQIASELGISEWTVSTHLRRIFAKLGVESRAAMVARCSARRAHETARAGKADDHDDDSE